MTESGEKKTENFDDILSKVIEKIQEAENDKDIQHTIALISHMGLMGLHIKALACHCECLGMNAENTMAVCGDYQPPYDDISFFQVMQKWGLIDKEGKSLI